ncbi:MAG TPA: YncE family protein [Edaphobacter sp.]|nr:YncE family protein [Edaphobacter sp.]
MRLLKLCLALLAFPFVQVTSVAQAPAPQAGLINRAAAAFSEKTDKLYLVDSDHDCVIALSASGSSETIKAGSRPVAVAINQNTGRVYAVNAGSRSVSVIDEVSGSVIASVPTAARPYAIAVDPSANRVYVSNTFSNMLTVIDGETNHAENIPTGSADAILVDSDRHHVYLLGYESDTITELNPTTGTTIKIPAGATHLWGMARAGHTLYVSHVQEHTIGAIDLESHQVRTLPVGSMPCAIAVNAGTDDLYVANYADGTITFIQKSLGTTVKVSPWPQALALDSSGHRLYVASPQQGTVSVVDTQTRKVIRTFRNLNHPYAVAFSPSTHRAYAVIEGKIAFTPLK